MATTGALQSGCFNGNSLSGATSCTSDKLTMVPSECTAMPTPAATGGSTSHIVTEDLLRKAVDSLEDLEQKVYCMMNLHMHICSTQYNNTFIFIYSYLYD
jgi:hypothetical protein